MVIADRAAGGEGVAEPVPVLKRQPVGDIRECRRALVGGDDEVGVIRVVAHRVRGRHDGPVRADIIGQVEQRVDEDFIGRDSLRHPRVAVGRGGEVLGDKAALGADWDDDRILDLLRFDEAENLSAEILRPVRPAQPAARHFAKTQVYALHSRRIDSDLEERARKRKINDPLALEFECDGFARLPRSVRLEKIRPDRRLREIEKTPENTVLIKARDGAQHGIDRGENGGLGGGSVTGQRGVETRMNQLHERLRDARMSAQSLPHIILGVADARLAQIERERAQHGYVAPAEPRLDHQSVITVAFRKSLEQRGEQCLDTGRKSFAVNGLARGMQQIHVMQPDRRGDFGVARRGTGRCYLKGPLADDLKAHMLHHRHALGEWHGPAARKHF